MNPKGSNASKKLYRVWMSYGGAKDCRGRHEITQEVIACNAVMAIEAVAGIEPDVPMVTVATVEQVAELERAIEA